MTYDAADGYTLLFGGFCSCGFTDYQDTWAFSGGVWTQITSSTLTPPAREGASMVYDPVDGYVVMFGGLDGATGTYLGDTWYYHAGQWTKGPTPNPGVTTPWARDDAGMTWDAVDGYAVLFGGAANSGLIQDTWKFVSGSWTQLSPTNSPPAREQMALSYDSTDGYVLLFGGTRGSIQFDSDSWKFIGGQWTNITGSVTNAPSARGGSVLVDDPTDGYVLLFGGWTYGGLLADTEVYAGGGWSTIYTPQSPPIRCYSSIAYDSSVDDVVLFGGWGTSGWNEMADTWAYPLPPVVSVSASPWRIDQGQWTNFSASTSSTYTYTWTGLPTGCSSSSVSTLACHATGTGTFNVGVTVTDSTGRSISSASTLSYQVLPDPSLTTPNPNPSWVEASEPMAFGVAASGGSGGYTYAWSALPFGCSSSNTSALSCTPSTPGTYPVTAQVHDSFGFLVASPTLSFIVHSNPSITLQENRTVMDLGQSITLWGNASGGSGTYSIWYQGLPCATANTSTLHCVPVSTGTFTITVYVNDTSGGTASSGTVAFTVHTDALATTWFSRGGLVALANESLILQINYTGGNPNYHPCLYAPGSVLGGMACGVWQGGSRYAFGLWYTAPGAYPLIASVEDSTGWNSTVSLTENVYWQLLLGSSSVPSTVDSGLTVSPSVVVLHGAPGFDLWINDTTASSLLCSTTSAQDGAVSCAFTAGWTGNHGIEVTVRDQLGYEVFSNSTLTVDPRPTLTGLSATVGGFSAGLGGTLEDEVGMDITFTATVSGGTSPLSWFWTYNGSAPIGTRSSLYFGFSHGGTYLVTVEAVDAEGLSAWGNLTVVVHPDLSNVVVSSHYTEVDVGVRDNLSVNWTNSLGTVGFTWDLGPGNTVTTSVPWLDRAMGTAGLTTIYVTVGDQGGVEVTSEVTFTVEVDPLLTALSARYVNVDAGVSDYLASGGVAGGIGPFHYYFDTDDGGHVNASSDAFNHTWDHPGSYLVSETITDSQGMFATDYLWINVSAPLAVTCSPSANATLVWVGHAVHVDLGNPGCISSGTPQYHVLVDWGDGRWWDWGNTSVYAWAWTSAGNFTVQIRVNDSGGGSASIGSLTVDVRPLGQFAPTIQSSTYQVLSNSTNGAWKEARVQWTLVLWEARGNPSAYQELVGLGNLSNATWRGWGTIVVLFNVTQANETQTVSFDLRNSYGLLSNAYTTSLNLSALFPPSGTKGGPPPGGNPGGGHQDGGLSMGEIFAIGAGIAMAVLVAVLIAVGLARKRRRAVAAPRSQEGPQAPPAPQDITKLAVEHIQTNPGVTQEALVGALGTKSGMDPEDVRFQLELLVGSKVLTRSGTGPESTYSLPTVVAASSPSAPEPDPTSTEAMRRSEVRARVEQAIPQGGTADWTDLRSATSELDATDNELWSAVGSLQTEKMIMMEGSSKSPKFRRLVAAKNVEPERPKVYFSISEPASSAPLGAPSTDDNERPSRDLPAPTRNSPG